MKTQRGYFVLLAGVLGIFLIGGDAGAQVWEEWVARYDGPISGEDAACSVALDAWGNVYVTGYSNGGESGFDYATIKYDAVGVQQWVARYNGLGNNADEATWLAVDSDGNAYVTGWTSGTITGSDYATIKYDFAGVEQWVAQYNGSGNTADSAYSLALDANGNVYVLGMSSSNYTTLKYNFAGEQQWAVQHGADYYHPAPLVVDIEANVYVAGTYYTWDPDYVTIKYNSSGVQQWSVFWNGWGTYMLTDFATSLAVDGEGSVYVTGSTWGASSHSDYGTVKYNSAGSLQWEVAYNGPLGYGSEYPHSLAVDGAANVYVTGTSMGLGGDYDYATVMYNSSGAQLWKARHTSPGYFGDVASSLAVDSAGNIYVTGECGNDYVTLKYNSSGRQLWEAQYNGPAGIDWAYSLAIDANGNVYVTGESQGSGTDYDYCTIKYTQTCPLDIALTLLSPQNQSPIEYRTVITNNAQSSQIFDAWVMTRLPNGTWYGPLLGPIELTLEGGAQLDRIRFQNVPSRAPAGNYWIGGYIGDYPAKWDSSGFIFIKLAAGGSSPGSDNWANTGEDFSVGASAAADCAPMPASASISAFPNPFNPITAISYQLPADSYVSLRVYDTAGRLVMTVVNAWREAGTHEATFDGSNLASGIYVYRLEAGIFSAVKKMVLLK